MAWQGVPYPSFISNTLDAGLTVTKIPELIINTGFGWDNVAGSVIAALVGAALPTAVAWYTIKKNDNSAAVDRANQIADLAEARANQIRLAEMSFNAQVLSANRQQWINNLREHIASLISALNADLASRNLYKIQFDAKSEAYGNRIDTFHKAMEIKKDISRIRTNIELMLNPAELTSRAIIKSMKDLSNMIDVDDPGVFYVKGSEERQQFMKSTDQLKRFTQRCLKSEWKRVKLGR